MEEDKKVTPRQRDESIMDAEAQSRRDESRANILRGHMRRGGDNFRDRAEEASEQELESARKAEKAREQGTIVDKSGTAPTMSDSAGNYAPNPDVANTGGVNVDASNSTEGGDQAKSVDDVSLDPAGVGVTDGDEVIGDPEEAQEHAGEPGAPSRAAGTKPSDKKTGDKNGKKK